MEEDRSALFNQLKNFSQRKLKKVETKVVTASGEQLVEKRGAKGLQVLGQGANGAANQETEPARKLDLQVGLILPGFLIGSQDVAHDKSSLDCYGVTHILNLDADIENKFEDDYNYKNIRIQDKPDFELEKVLEECFDFIDDGRHYGNVLVHCSGTIGLSRSTAICIAYLMNKENQKLDEAFNTVKEARSFVKPNEGFMKQLRDYEVKLRGAQQVKESGIDDPFALRKKQEIEQEKAMVAGAASVKNRMKMFGATLDTGAARSKSVSPSPLKTPTPAATTTSTSTTTSQPSSGSKWSSRNNSNNNNNNYGQADNNKKPISKSMTPEPRKSWQQHQPADTYKRPDWRAREQQSSPSLSSSSSPGGPPPPPPPQPGSLYANDKSVKPLASSTNSSSRSSNKSSLPPPPPPPPPGDLLKDSSSKSSKPVAAATSSNLYKSAAGRKASISAESSGDDEGADKQRMVFGRRPPPPMKIRGGLSIERHDSTSDKNMGFTKQQQQPGSTRSKASLQLPLKKQFTSDSDGESGGKSAADNPRAPSPSAALRAAKQQVAAKQAADESPSSSSRSNEQRRPSATAGQLNRSSTKKILNLIKTKTRTDLTLADGDEQDEIDALLGALEGDNIDNIDWDELGLDENEIKDIIQRGGESSSSSGESSSDEDEEDEDEEDEEELETSTQHYVIRTK